MIPAGPFGQTGSRRWTDAEDSAAARPSVRYSRWSGLIPAPPAPIQTPQPNIQFSPALTISVPNLGGLPWQLVAWALRLEQVVNLLLVGKLNATFDLTLTPNAASTTVTDARIAVTSFLSLTPMNDAAAAEQAAGGLFIGSLQNGSAVIEHSNAGTPNRMFRVLIIG